MSSDAKFANQINAAVRHVQRAAHAARRETPPFGPVLDEIEHLAGEIAEDCAAGPIATGAAPGESPRVDEHAAGQAGLTGEGYHEADLAQADSFKQQSDVSEYTLAEKGTAAKAFENGFTVADVMATDARGYEEALEKTRVSPAAASSRRTDSVADVVAGVRRLLKLYRGKAATTAEAARRIGELEALVHRLSDA